MVIFVLAALLVIGMISAYYKLHYNNNVGVNVGEKHMREQWGIDDNQEYHE